MATRNPAETPVEVGSLSHCYKVYKALAPSQVVGNGISEASTVFPGGMALGDVL